MTRFVAVRNEIGDQLLEASRKTAGDGDRPRSSGHRHDTAHAPSGDVATASMRQMPVPGHYPVMGAMKVTGVMMMGGMCREGNSQKNRGRNKQSHYSYLCY